MKALVDYDSDGHSESDYTVSKTPDETLKHPKMPPDIDAIIWETRTEMEQARLKADQLICQFAETYVETAGRFRDGAIQRYRDRLEGLPAEVCAKVCETLAKDDIFCCNMEFGNGHLSYGGMSFTYKVESDAAFNALSHHAWKDMHQRFVKDEPPMPLENAPEQGRVSVDHLMLSDDDEDGMGLDKERPDSSSESDSSSDEEDSLCSGDSNWASQKENREKDRNNLSPPPDWATEDESGHSDAPKKRGPGRPRKHPADSVVPEKQGNEPWSAKEEALIREMMAMQLRRKKGYRYNSKILMKLSEVFPIRSISAIKSKWLRMEAKLRAQNVKGKVSVEDPDLEEHCEEDSAPLKKYADGHDENSNDREVKGRSHEIISWIKNKWTPEQDKILTKRMQSEMQSSGVAKMSVPSAVREELARSFGRNEKSISRRWSYLSGDSTWGGKEKKKKEKKKMRLGGSVLAKSEPQVEAMERIQASSSRLPHPKTPVQPVATDSAGASGLQHKDQSTREHRAPAWSPHEVETLTRLTKGLNRLADIDFKEVAARLPDPSIRTEKACKVFWARHVQSHQPDKDQDPIQGNDTPEKGDPGFFSELSRSPVKKGKRRGPEHSSDSEPPKHSKKAKSTSKTKLPRSEKAPDSSRESRRRPWTREEDDLLWRLALSGIPWRAVAAQIPHRTEGSCHMRYSSYLLKDPEYQARLHGRSGRPVRKRGPRKRDPESDRDSFVEEDTVISLAQRSNHANESGDEGRKRSVDRRKRRGDKHAQSSFRKHDKDDGSEVEGSDVYMYDFE